MAWILGGALAAGACFSQLAAAQYAPVVDTRPAPPNTRPAAARPGVQNDNGNWWDNAAPPAGAGNPAAAGNPAPQPPFRDDRPNIAYGGVTDLPAIQLRDWVSANAWAARARAMFRRAESELGAAIRLAQFHFERSKDYQDAVAAEKQAYADYTAARQRALASLKDDTRYQSIMQLCNELADKLARRRAAKDVTKDEILAMATLKMQYASDARQMEVAVLSADSNLKAAHDRMVEASRRVVEMRQRFDDSIRDNPQILLARRNLEDARVALIEAEAYAYAATVSGQAALNYSYYLHRNDNGGVYGPYGGGGGYASPYWARY